MPDLPKDKQVEEPKPAEPTTDDNWEEDQKKHVYYYDDSHGYQDFVPGNEDEDSATDD